MRSRWQIAGCFAGHGFEVMPLQTVSISRKEGVELSVHCFIVHELQSKAKPVDLNNTLYNNGNSYPIVVHIDILVLSLPFDLIPFLHGCLIANRHMLVITSLHYSRKYKQTAIYPSAHEQMAFQIAIKRCGEAVLIVDYFCRRSSREYHHPQILG